MKQEKFEMIFSSFVSTMIKGELKNKNLKVKKQISF